MEVLPPSSPLSSDLSTVPSSPLSSANSRSPSPPDGYPTPPSSGPSEQVIASKVRKALHDAEDSERAMPPPKRQRIPKSKELKTEYLDLNELNEIDSEEHHKIENEKIKRLTEVLLTKRKIVVIAGAGISVSAGIPDFRSATGLFASLREKHKLKSSGKHLFDADVYRNDKTTSAFHDMVRELSQQTKKAKPTPFHHMLATLAEEGRLLRLYTQNVDGLEASLPPLATTVPLNVKGPWPKTIQLHGGLGKMVCTKCGDVSAFEAELFNGPETPLCQVCQDAEVARKVSGLRGQGVGRLRPRMALYSERNADEDAIGAVSDADLKSKPDAVIVVGTTLKVPGTRRLTKELCSLARDKRGGFTAWINSHDPAPTGIEFKDCWDLVVKGDCDEVAGLVGLPQWDNKDCGEYKLIENDAPKEKSPRPEVVVLELKPGDILKGQGMLTPTDSPRDQSPAPSSNIGKLKQQVLSFGSSNVSTTDSKQKKKSGRKPLPSKPILGVGIQNMFSTTKSKVSRPKKDFESDDNSTSQAAMFPNLTSEPTKQPVGRPPKQPTPPASRAPSMASGNIRVPKGPESTKSDDGMDFGSRPISNPPKRPKSAPGIRGFLDRKQSDHSGVPAAESNFAVEIPVPKTPVVIPSEFGTRRPRETISPKSVPRGMGNMID